MNYLAIAWDRINPLDWLVYELGELAQLRNEIAHGSFEGRIESFELIIERAEFIKNFGIALAEIMFRSYEEVLFNGKERLTIGKASKTFPNKNCFGFKGQTCNSERESFKVRVGDSIYSHHKNGNCKLISGHVSSLMLNQVEVDELDVPNELDFAIKVDFDVTTSMTNRELSILKRN